MAYDPATDATALRAEVIDNQAHYGDPGATKAVLDRLNTKTADSSICRTPQDSTARTISGFDLLEAMMADKAEYTTAVTTASQQTLIVTLVELYERDIPTRFQQELISLTGVFNATVAPTIRNAIIAEATGPQSMSEILFGDDTVITKRDWVAARGPDDGSGGWS